MKFDLKSHKSNTKCIILAVVGGCISITGYLAYILSPLQMIVDKVITMQPNSLIYKLWSNPPYEILAKIYIFNVTNSEQFLAGREKLNLSEVGPFVYQETLTNADGYFNENNTLTFKPKREHILRKELSVSDPDSSWIISPNIPLLGISSFVKDNYGYFMNLGFSSVTNMLKSTSMRNLTPTEYLFGYEDPLVTMASTYIPSWIDFSKFGILDRLLAVDNNNTVTIHLPKTTSNGTLNTDIPLPYSIDVFNGSPGLEQWGYVKGNNEENSICNTIEGAYEGGLYPSKLKENTTIRVYRRAFCRAVTLNYENSDYTPEGFPYYGYRVDRDFLGTPHENSNNECFCRKTNDCLPKGFGSMAPCYYGIPIVMSQPHYLNSDPQILSQVNGLNPDREKHDTTMKVSPILGIPLGANLRIQINLKVSDNQFVGESKPFQGMIVPLFWVELELYKMQSYVISLLYLVHAIPAIEIAIASVLGILGISLISTAFLFAWYCPHYNLEDPYENIVGYSPILVLPLQQHLRTEIRRIS